MIPTQISNNIVRLDTPAVYAFYIVQKALHYPLVLVCDNDDRVVGVIGKSEINIPDLHLKTCGEICEVNFSSIYSENEGEVYTKARNIFAEKHILTLPIIDKIGRPIKLFGRFQAFFHEQHGGVPYSHYAFSLMQAARIAKSRGYFHISALEFGVASGNGLVSLEIYAKEIGKLNGITIDVYGFDAGKGLFPPVDYRDCNQTWIEGDYKSDMDVVADRLYFANLVLGDICDTAKTFLQKYNPHPIGFISVDVDQYHPTAAILNMLTGDEEFFLPSLPIFFDDIKDELEHQGETLAVREFNKQNEYIKISPEHTAFDQLYRYWSGNNGLPVYPALFDKYGMSRMKWCHRFNHPRFSANREGKQVL